MRGVDRARTALRGELRNLHPRWALARLLMAPLPLESGTRARALILRLLGFRIGAGVVLSGPPRLFGSGPLHRRLSIGADTFVNVGLTAELGADVSIGSQVGFGPDVALLTTTHHIGTSDQRRGVNTKAPIHIGDGAWLGARVTVLPGVTIGPGAVVGAGAVVIDDVEEDTLVAGVPARMVRRLDPREAVAGASRRGLHRSAP